MKPYHHVPIHECHEPLVPLPLPELAVVTPHPYVALGAPYGDRSPYWLRQTVVEALRRVQVALQAEQPGWRLQVFDAYRPIPVQQFMVDYTTQDLAHQQGLDWSQLSMAQQQTLLETVYQFWALPSPDPQTPPPHSTGAAIDLTLIDAQGLPVAMGSPIDEVSARSHPDYFQAAAADHSQFHAHRCLLQQLMTAAGFQQHPAEWWHFSNGDQLWAWLTTQQTGQFTVAHYGCAEPPPYSA